MRMKFFFIFIAVLFFGQASSVCAMNKESKNDEQQVRFRCPLCGKNSYLTHSGCYRHIKTCENNPERKSNLFYCFVCSKYFTSKNNLERHQGRATHKKNVMMLKLKTNEIKSLNSSLLEKLDKITKVPKNKTISPQQQLTCRRGFGFLENNQNRENDDVEDLWSQSVQRIREEREKQALEQENQQKDNNYLPLKKRFFQK